MKRIIPIGLIIYLIIVGFLWFQAFNLTGILWRENKPSSLLAKTALRPPEPLLPPVRHKAMEEKLRRLGEPKIQKIKDRRLYSIKCECGCQDVLAECHGGNPCLTALRQIKELGIEL